MKKALIQNLLRLVLPCLLFSMEASAQNRDEYTLKAALSYNFAKYTQWSANTAVSHIELCYFNDSYTGSFTPLTQRTIDSRPIVIRRLASPAEIDGCNLLYIDRDHNALFADLLRILDTRPILTISDFKDFCESGGMIEIQTIDNKLKFRINFAALEAADISLGSQVLSLATEILR